MTDLDIKMSGIRELFTLEPVKGPDNLLRAPMSLRKPSGQRIRCLFTAPAQPWRGVVVIMAGLGRTIRHSCALALAAAHHGYATVRFDPTNHTGDSDGDIFDITLSQLGEDLLFVCNTLRSAGWSDRLFVVSSSSLARAAIRTPLQGLPADGLILVLPVVCLARTLIAVSGEDLVEQYRSGQIQISDPVTVLTHQMSGRFLADAIEHHYHELDVTRSELRQIEIPVAMIVAEDDDWISIEDVVVALEPDRPQRHLFVLENSDHDSYSFGFVRAVTQSAIQSLADMNHDERTEELYSVTFSKLSRAIKTETELLNRARELWRLDD
jgi:pimeloyl-ACP methyl ester carboxylesterase